MVRGRGPLIRCPKCGQTGRETIIKVTAKGHTYFYRAVVHADGRKCTIGRAKPPTRVEEEVKLQQLERENRELRELLDHMLSSGIVIHREQLLALKSVYVTKKGYTPQQLQLAKQIMHTMIERGLDKGACVVSFMDPGKLTHLGSEGASREAAQ